jgi:hypothetical protein
MSDYNGFTGQQRTKALRWLNREYAAGRRVRPTRCGGCGQTAGIIEAHSEDYSEPFGDHIGAFGFCYRCHMALHNRLNAPEAWERYKAAIVAGTRFLPFEKRNWYGFRAQHLTAWNPAIGVPGPAHPDILSRIG